MPDPSVICIQAYDGLASLDLLYEKLQPTGYRAMAYVAPRSVGMPNKVSLGTLQQLDRADWDVCYHANSDQDLTALSANDLHREVYTTHDWLVRHGFARGARHAAPYSFLVGAREYAVLKAVGYRSIIAANPTYALSPHPAYTMVQQTASDNIAWGTVTAALQTAVSTPNTILWLGLHDVTTGTPVGLDTSLERLDKLLTAVKATGLQVVTFSDMLA